MIAEKETDLKMKRLFRPRWITIYYRVISKCKGHECNFTWAASHAYK
jgi:putative component of membrane protein insertase Oxa1/YidC/SpoIIIJ protein YidD